MWYLSRLSSFLRKLTGKAEEMIKFKIAGDRHFLLFHLVMLFAVHSSNGQCATGMCEKKSLSLKTDTKHNTSLDGYVFEALNFSNWEECFNMCVRKCKCLSFNFNEVNKTENCELNDADTKLAPEALKDKEGVVYHEITRTFYDKDGSPRQTCSDSTCHNKCCDFAPCQHGGTCREVCDVNKRRFNCTCPPGFTGHKCQFSTSRSCKDVMVIRKETTNGIYNIVDQNNISFPVFCDFGSEPGAAWTLIQSHSFQNNAAFKSKAFYLHDMPTNQDAPEWNSYRLSMSRMKSIQDLSTHWRATCNFPTDGVDYRDYWRVSLKSLDLLVQPAAISFCLFSEILNVRGNECVNCTVWSIYSVRYTIHIDSWSTGCEFNGQHGGIVSEDNFGFYGKSNPDFRCASSVSSTSQVWLGNL